MLRFCVVLSLLCVLGFSVGCGDPNGKQEISGTVTLKGEPLDDGIIEFSSPNAKTGAPILKGKYLIPAEHGLVPGKYKVVITAGDGRTPADSPDGMPGPTGANIISKDRIPPEYNKKSTQEVTVTNKAPNVFDYAIP
jgi:hypothetical protein